MKYLSYIWYMININNYNSNHGLICKHSDCFNPEAAANSVKIVEAAQTMSVSVIYRVSKNIQNSLTHKLCTTADFEDIGARIMLL